jgi:hypothetical protein
MAFRERFIGKLRFHQDETVGMNIGHKESQFRISDVEMLMIDRTKKGAEFTSAPFWFQSLL